MPLPTRPAASLLPPPTLGGAERMGSLSPSSLLPRRGAADGRNSLLPPPSSLGGGRPGRRGSLLPSQPPTSAHPRRVAGHPTLGTKGGLR